MPLLALRSLYEEQAGDVTVHVDGVSGQPGIGAFHVEGAIVALRQDLTLGGGMVFGGRTYPRRWPAYPQPPTILPIDGVEGIATIAHASIGIALRAQTLRGTPRIGRANVNVACSCALPRIRGVTTNSDLTDEEIIALCLALDDEL